MAVAAVDELNLTASAPSLAPMDLYIEFFWRCRARGDGEQASLRPGRPFVAIRVSIDVATRQPLVRSFAALNSRLPNPSPSCRRLTAWEGALSATRRNRRLEAEAVVI